MAEESTNKPAPRSERIGKYEILGHIATGGMAVIYKARDTNLDRLVALKILPPEMSGQQITLIRFEREAKAAAHLHHENIVTIFDVGESDATHYIAFEYIEGTDLQTYITRKSRLDPDEARQITIQATHALVHAHEKGVVHRDIKPANFLLTQKGKRLIVKLTDFGLAIRNENDAEFRVTKDKMTVGTVDYMAPEQARDSRAADIRSDIYSLGCTFFHMLAGNAPFAQGSMPERIVQHMQAPPPDVRRMNQGIPAAYTVIINRMLAKKPADRYQTPAELLEDLEHPERVAPKSKRTPAVGKLEDGRPRKRPVEPTALVEGAASRRVKPAMARKPAPNASVPPSAVDVVLPPEATETREMDVDADDVTEEPQDQQPKLREPTGKPPNSPIWMYATAASVGVLGLVLVFALVFGGRTPVKKDEKPPVKNPDPQPVVVEPPEEPDEKPPPKIVIDASPAKMGVGMLELPIMDPQALKPDRAAMRKEYFGEFTSFPEAPEKATVLRMGRLAAGPASFRSLADAFAQTEPDAFTVIEIQDNGPIFVPALPALTKRTILLRAAEGYRPLLAWETPSNFAETKPAETFLSLTGGKLILDNLDIVVQWPVDAPAVLFDLPNSDLFARGCTFSAASKSGQALAVVRRKGLPAPTERLPQTWLQHCCVRGPDIALLQQSGVGGDLLIEESLIVGNRQPLIQMGARDVDALAINCVRSTLATGQMLLRWEPLSGKEGRPRLRVRALDSILSRHDSAAAIGDMIDLVGTTDLAQLNWRSANTIYAGWKQLLASGSKKIAGHDMDTFRQQMGGFGNAGIAVVDSWPRGISGVAEQPTSSFLPGASEVAYAALSGSGSIGCVIGRLPPAPESWRERIGEQRKVPLVPLTDAAPSIDAGADGFYHGERLDLNKVDLAEHLRIVQQTKRLAPRVVLHLEGKGACTTGPVHVKGIQQLVLYFTPAADPKNALMLELNTSKPLLRPPMFEMSGGRLELIGLNVRLSPTTLMPTIVHVKSGDLSMTRCRLQGPLTALAENFHSLVTVSNAGPTAATLLLRDNVLTSAKLLIQLDDHVQLKARNNAFLSLGDAVRMDNNRPAVPLVHLLDHNTFAARQNCFTLRTGPDFEATANALMHANSNAFLHPFADAEQGTFLRGGQAWVQRGRWTWQGRYNVYDTRWHAWLNGVLDQPAGKQKLADWKLAWGQVGEQNAISFDAGPMAKLIQTDNVTQPALLLQLDRLALPRTLRGDPEQTPPGADLLGLGIPKKKG
jgi:serine/threonine protein kinase